MLRRLPRRHYYPDTSVPTAANLNHAEKKWEFKFPEIKTAGELTTYLSVYMAQAALAFSGLMPTNISAQPGNHAASEGATFIHAATIDVQAIGADLISNIHFPALDIPQISPSTLKMTQEATIALSDFVYRTKFPGMDKSMDDHFKDTPRDLVEKAKKLAGIKKDIKIEGMHDLFAVMLAREVLKGNFNIKSLNKLYTEIYANVIRNKDGKPVYSYKNAQGSIISTILTEKQVLEIVTQMAKNCDSSTPPPPSDTRIEPMSSETRAIATAQAIDKLRIKIPKEQRSQFDLILLSSSLPLTIENIQIINNAGSVSLVVDDVGAVVALTLRTNMVGITSSILVMGNVAQYTVEMPPYGYTQPQMIKMSTDGWAKVLVQQVNSNTIITDVNGKACVQINTPSSSGGSMGNKGKNQLPTPSLSVNEKPVPPDVTKLEERLRDRRVIEELGVAIRRSTDSRIRDGVTPPTEDLVKEFRAVIYDPAINKIVIGKWNSLHARLATDNGITWNFYGLDAPPYFAGIQFELTPVNKPVFKIDVNNGLVFTQEDLHILEGAGFRVMNENWEWLVADPSNPIGFYTLPSYLNPEAR